MNNRNYNSKLRALLSIRNFKGSFKEHYAQMLQLQNNFVEFNANALSIIEANCSLESQEKWKENLREVNDLMSNIDRVITFAKEKIEKKNRTDTAELWEKFDLNLESLIESNVKMGKLGFEILPEEEHKHWQKDVINFEETLLPLIVSYAKACRVELEMIEKYMPKELDKVTQVIVDHIPEEFTFEEADKYEKDYLKAIEDLANEYKQGRNLWDKFLDILAGGKHQSPSQRVMMQRWIEGEMHDL